MRLSMDIWRRLGIITVEYIICVVVLMCDLCLNFVVCDIMCVGSCDISLGDV